jgi:hypothetical protein
MRTLLLALPIVIAATPVSAQQPSAPPKPDAEAKMQQALNDPATADRLAQVMQALSNAFLQLPVGEVQAALEGRPATPAEKKLTVRDAGRKDDPNFDKTFREQMANSRPIIAQSMKALAGALPAMMKGMGEASKALEQAAENAPRPNYPKQ